MATKPEADEAAKPAAKNKKMMLIVGGLVVVLLLAAGGWFFMSRQHAPVDGEEEEEDTHAAVVHEGPPTFLPLDSMVVNLADPGGERVAQVGITLELSDAKAVDKVKAYLPAIRSSVLMLVSQRKAEDLLQLEGKEQLADDILNETWRILGVKKPAKKKKKTKDGAGDNPVNKVLLTSLIIQ